MAVVAAPQRMAAKHAKDHLEKKHPSSAPQLQQAEPRAKRHFVDLILRVLCGFAPRVDPGSAVFAFAGRGGRCLRGRMAVAFDGNAWRVFAFPLTRISRSPARSPSSRS
ncbi:MAG TPA: hypothetical protein VFQ53_19910 [Kofleriaceae bacterium]|nr:hypothetical protein [Kofleriaceae bacterium]